MRRTLAAHLSGTFPTAYPDGPPAGDEAAGDDAAGDDAAGDDAAGDDEKAPSLASGESLVLLFADSDLLQDDVCVRMNSIFGLNMPTLVSDNINLFVSAVEQAAGDSDLLAVRGRGRATRTFTVVDELERKAQLKFLEKEKDLEAKLNATRERLRELQTQKTGQQRFILSPEQQTEIARFREEEHHFRRELRDVRKSLRRDIEMLGVRVKVLNILAVPLLVTLAGIVQGVRRRRV